MHPEDLFQRAAESFGERPTGQRFRDRIQEGDVRLFIGGDDRVANGFNGGGEPALDPAQFAFDLMLAQRQLDAGLEVVLAEGLHQVAERLGVVRTLNGRVVHQPGQEDHRDVELRPQSFGRLNAIDLAPQPDVHQGQMRLGSLSLAQGLFACRHAGRHRVAGMLEVKPDQLGYGRIVFDHEDSFVRHADRKAFGRRHRRSPPTAGPRVAPGRLQRQSRRSVA